jgi:ribosomal protein L12E/L44/L45/RPP1/RPP2
MMPTPSQEAPPLAARRQQQQEEEEEEEEDDDKEEALEVHTQVRGSSRSNATGYRCLCSHG